MTLVTGVLVGIAPTLLETRRLQTNPGLAKPSDRVPQRWRHGLVVLVVAVTVALLVVTTTMVDAYRRGLFVDPGFPVRPLLIASVDNAKGVPLAQILERLEALPGVASIGASTSAPFWAPPPIGWCRSRCGTGHAGRDVGARGLRRAFEAVQNSAGVSQEAMACRLGVDPSTLAQRESERRMPTGEYLTKVEEALGK